MELSFAKVRVAQRGFNSLVPHEHLDSTKRHTCHDKSASAYPVVSARHYM
jgi:hypothetical protein